MKDIHEIDQEMIGELEASILIDQNYDQKIKSNLSESFIVIDDECLLSVIDQSGTIKLKTEFKGFPYRIDTTNLPNGLYYVNIVYKGKTSTIRLVIKH